MKAVAFVCLLSLSFCLSQPTSISDSQPSKTPSETDKKTNLTKQEGTVQSTLATTVDVKLLAGANDTEKAKAPSPSPTHNETKPSDAKPQTETTNKTETVNETAVKQQNESKVVEPTKKDTKETATEDKLSPKPNEEGKAPATGTGTTTSSTTEKPTEKITEAPKDTTEKPLVGKRGFDGPSFIGGIILTLGLLAIGFMGFKYYKNQTERNYHTL